MNDALVAREHEKWNHFYENREKPIPFFNVKPDEHLVEWLDAGKIKGTRAIDLGCGNARNALYLAQRGFDVVAVDYSETAIAWAREIDRACGATLAIYQASVFELPPFEYAFDLVLDSGCFHHIAPHQRGEYVALVSRLLSPHGAFVMACFSAAAGSGLSDDEVYAQNSMRGGLGYDEAHLRKIWGGAFKVECVRAMRECGDAENVFGKAFLNVALIRKMKNLPCSAP